MICYEDIQKIYRNGNLEVNTFDKPGTLALNPQWLVVGIFVNGIDKKIPELPYGGFARITEDTLLYTISRALDIPLAHIDSFMKNNDITIYFYLPHTNECLYFQWRQNAIGEYSWRSIQHSGDCCDYQRNDKDNGKKKADVWNVWKYIKDNLAMNGLHPIGNVYNGKIMLCGDTMGHIAIYDGRKIKMHTIELIENLIEQYGATMEADIEEGVWVIEVE